jgi:hypothetical protein
MDGERKHHVSFIKKQHTDHQYGKKEYVHESMNFFLDAKSFFPVCVFSTEKKCIRVLFPTHQTPLSADGWI